MEDSVPYWLPLVTLALGLIGGYFADYLPEGRAASRERAAALDAFQRETLIELQDAAAGMHRQLEMEYLRSGAWRRGAVGEMWILAEREALMNSTSTWPES
jgi:hypothetical protein